MSQCVTQHKDTCQWGFYDADQSFDRFLLCSDSNCCVYYCGCEREFESPQCQVAFAYVGASARLSQGAVPYGLRPRHLFRR
jgi:hypothetical protein